MLEPASVLLKYGFLAVLFLFLVWVSRNALKDLRGSRAEAAAAGGPGASETDQATGLHSRPPGDNPSPQLVVASAPGHQHGLAYDIGDGAVLGRGDQAEIRLEDSFASSRHARLVRQGAVIVLEDMGSTNGTYLNGELLEGPQPLHAGDRVRIGESEFVYEDG